MADEMNKCAEHTEEELFKEAGECSDEVILTFDDGENLYVSENFLCYASPVFKAMFKHDFKEKETREILMMEKSFEDVHEFLLCLHPAVQKPIDYENVLRVVALADEYQVNLIINKCKDTMKKWMLFQLQSAQSKTRDLEAIPNLKQYAQALTCLKILKKADECSYEEIVDYAIKILGKFGYNIVTGLNSVPAPSKPFSHGDPVCKNVEPVPMHCLFGIPNPYGFSGNAVYNQSDPLKDCFTLYNSLTEHMKRRLALARLRNCDDGKLR